MWGFRQTTEMTIHAKKLYFTLTKCDVRCAGPRPLDYALHWEKEMNVTSD